MKTSSRNSQKNEEEEEDEKKSWEEMKIMVKKLKERISEILVMKNAFCTATTTAWLLSWIMRVEKKDIQMKVSLIHILWEMKKMKVDKMRRKWDHDHERDIWRISIISTRRWIF